MKKLKILSGLLACTLFSPFFSISPKAAEATSCAKNDTELVMVVDKSGSMHHLRQDTIGNFNSVIEEQKNSDASGDVYVTTVMFNHSSDKIHDRKNIQEIKNITEKDYRPQGCTALLDAVGNTITELSNNKDIDGHKVVLVVITDGLENSSKEFDVNKIKKLVEEKKKENWNFIFLGANIDSFSESGKLGMDKHCTRNFVASADGVKEAFGRVSTAINQVRTGKKIDLDENLEPKDDNQQSANNNNAQGINNR